MFLEHTNKPSHPVEQLTSCPACDYLLRPQDADRRCSECGLPLPVGGRLIFIDRRREWRGWSLIRKVVFLFIISLPICGAVGIITMRRAGTIVATSPAVSTTPNFFVLRLAAVVISSCYVVAILFLTRIWLMADRRRKGIIVAEDHLVLFGLTPDIRVIHRREIESISLRSIYSARRPGDIKTVKHPPIKFPHLLKWSVVERRELSAALLHFAMTADSRIPTPTRPELGCYRIHPLIPCIQRSMKRFSDLPGFGLGAAYRGHLPMLLICAIVFDLILRFHEFSRLPFQLGQWTLPKSSIVYESIGAALIFVCYLVLRRFGPWLQVVHVGPEGIVVNRQSAAFIQLRWNEIADVQTNFIGICTIVTTNGMKEEISDIRGDEIAILRSVHQRVAQDAPRTSSREQSDGPRTPT